MITDRDLVLAAAATYTTPQADFVGLNGTARAFRTMVDDTAVYAIEGQRVVGGELDALEAEAARDDLRLGTLEDAQLRVAIGLERAVPVEMVGLEVEQDGDVAGPADQHQRADAEDPEGDEGGNGVR